MLPAGFRGRWWLIVAGRRWVGRGWVGGGVGGMGGAGMGGGLGIAARIPNRGIGGAGIGVRESGIRNSQNSEFAELRNRGIAVSEFTGVHICAHGMSGIRRIHPPESRKPAPGTPRKPPN